MPSFASFIEMATARRQSNVERTEWRAKCREALCKHINSTLGMTLKPSQVRLHPTRDDPYQWRVLPEKQYLFEKNLSDYSVGVYKELHDGIGVSFRAIRAAPTSPDGRLERDTLDPFDKATMSFASRINQLQVQKDYAAQEVNLLKSQLEAEVKLRLSLEEKLQIAYERQESLQKGLRDSANRENYFRTAALTYSQGIAKVLPALRDLTEKTFITETGFI
ncbi:hypothetical protein AK830_g5497 [Neonectria ditissima]|uniref:Uncharacterized protein n=1 Tax=Neonectria ditissima TaxID=78410 RepID=A0A0P7BLT5_9HYPO|nr:hypothetical protein AK830_g5497 [Neonectria ditissima]